MRSNIKETLNKSQAFNHDLISVSFVQLYIFSEVIIMVIAVTHENGQVYQHFGHSKQFKLYTVENGEITSFSVVDTNGSGHGALAGFLQSHGVNALICGGIGAGAKTALQNAGIALYGGVSGSCDSAVVALLSDRLSYNSDITCSHHHDHGEEHDCGNHDCGEHSCGEH